MKVDVNDLSGCSKEVHVEVSADILQGKVDGIYQRLGKQAKMPGFRKGKVPLDVLKREYKSAVREEIVHQEVPEFFRTILIDHKIEPVTQPRITHLQFEEGSPLKFVAIVEIKPGFKLKDFKGIKVRKEPTKVTEEEVDRALEALREQMAQFVPVEDRSAKEEDLVLIDFDGKIDGKSFDGGKAARFPVLLGSQGLLKDFETQLIGMAKGASKNFKLTFPADYPKPEVAGKEAEFAVTLQEIKVKKLPAVDDEFAKDAGGGGNVKELREKLEGQLRSRKEAEQRAKMAEQVGDKLISDHPFDVPVSLVDMEQQRLVRQGVDRLRQQGLDPARLTPEQRKDFVEKLRPVAEKNVRMALIVERISEQEGVRCEDGDLDAYIQKIAQATQQPPEAVRRYLSQKGEMASTREWIRYEKTIDLLIAQAKVEAA